MLNQGEMRIKVKVGKIVGLLNSHAVSEAKKPLASAAKIANKGNRIVMGEDGCDAYIENKLAGNACLFTRTMESMF